MKLIIVGMGLTGTHLARLTAQEGHDVVVVDADQKKVDEMTDRYSVSGVCGSGASREVLLKAGADTADIVVALTRVDEVNLICCKTAKDCGARYAAAKVESPEFFAECEYLKREFSVDYVVNPKQAAAETISRQIGLPVDVKAEGFFGGDEAVISLTVDEASELCGRHLRDAKQILGADTLIGTVCRKGKLYVPKGDFKLHAGDEVSIIAARRAILDIARKMGRIHKPVKNVLIVGGGAIGEYLAGELLKAHKSVKVLDSDRERCIKLREQLPAEIEVALVDGIDAEVLTKEGIKNADVCVCLTGQDETNLIVSLFAWSCGVSSVITKVNAPSYESLLNKVHINITISPVVITADALLAFLRNVAVYNDEGNDIQTMYRLADGLGEAIEFIAYESSRGVGIPFKSPEFRTRDDVLIGVLIRDGKSMIPDGDSQILPGDHVVVIAKASHGLATLDDIFEQRA